MPKKIIFAYIPVLHEGYRQFFERHSEADELLIWGNSIVQKFDHLERKDIRALPAEMIKRSLETWDLPFSVSIVEISDLGNLNSPKIELVSPEEDEAKEIIQRYLLQVSVTYDNYFLRWDRSRSTKEQPLQNDVEISQNEFDKKMMQAGFDDAQKSSDWWRQVGAVVVKDNQILMQTHNQPVPSQQMPYVNGDPRGNFHKGEHIDLSTAIPAEPKLIAQAAQQGISLQNCEMYVTTFPCPNCAKLIAYSGISTLFYRDGYAMVDGESILKNKDVKIVRVTP